MRKKVKVLMVALSCTALPAPGADKPDTEQCAPFAELTFLCGMKNPEDLVGLPGGRWIVASGMAPKSGLHLIDGNTKTWKRWTAPINAKAKAPFHACPSQPAADELQIHGISVRDVGNGRMLLYAVNHGGTRPITEMNIGGGRETIEVFTIDMTANTPALTWEGCVPMPTQRVANSVTSDSSGSIFATVMLHPTDVMSDLWTGKATGAVYKWSPGEASFQRIAGTELTANNGIEVSPDRKTLYVNSLDAVNMFTNTNPARLLKTAKIKNGFADNLHWANNRLIVAGSRTDLCPADASGAPCQQGYHVSTVDPETLAITTLAEGPRNPQFSGTSVGLLIGKTLWIGSHSSNKLAYRILN